MSHWPVSVQTLGLLILSDVFMTFAWYGHLKNLSAKPWWDHRAGQLGDLALFSRN